MINISNVSKEHRKKRISLRDIHFHIEKGDFVAIVGDSGSGKTTLLKIIIAEEKPSSGTVYFHDVNVHRLRRKDIPKYRQQIGVVFQDYRLLNHKTVWENVSFVLEVLGVSEKDIEDDVTEILKLVSLLDKKDLYPSELSGGEQQRLAIARALVRQPDVLFVDEPTSSLDEENKKIIFDILSKIHELGTTVVLFTHSVDIPHLHRKHVKKIFLKKGKISHQEE